jgi:hypothetical protein
MLIKKRTEDVDISKKNIVLPQFNYLCNPHAEHISCNVLQIVDPV